jgi:hypothetical protein
VLEVGEGPAAVEEGLGRGVEAEVDEPAVLVHRLNPVAFQAGGRRRSYVQVCAAIGVALERFVAAVEIDVAEVWLAVVVGRRVFSL